MGLNEQSKLGCTYYTVYNEKDYAQKEVMTMAVIETNQETKAKLVYQLQSEKGEMRQTSRTFSNLAAGASNDALHAGLSARAGLLDVSGASIVRVDESELVSE